MSDAVARLRVFAGPNGSGKSTIKDALRPEINIERVRNRVLNGGHPVPRDKILERQASTAIDSDVTHVKIIQPTHITPPQQPKRPLREIHRHATLTGDRPQAAVEM